MVNTPVLYITFARPEYASQSFAAIKKAQPKKLYFYSNKARKDRPDEIRRNEEVRSYVQQIDWDCEVKTWFRDEYVDIYTSLWGAMDWLFDNEPMGIVLEEDCVASGAFFDYCDQLLPKYMDEKRVWIISGDNYTPEANPRDLDYFFVHSAHIYGWASWANRWHSLDRKMERWNELSLCKRIRYNGSLLQTFWGWYRMRNIHKNIDTKNPWDFIFSFNKILNDGLGIIPKKNLVSDIGTYGVHHTAITSTTTDADLINEDVSFPIVNEPKEIRREKHYDSFSFYHHDFYPTIKRKWRKLLQMMHITQLK